MGCLSSNAMLPTAGMALTFPPLLPCLPSQTRAAIIVSFFFFVSLFFSPIFSSIPPYATGPALILVGVMLIAHVDRITWDDTREAVPAFLTIIIMPFTLSGRARNDASWQDNTMNGTLN